MESDVRPLLSLNWDDIIIPHILPYLTVKELFLLRPVCAEALDLVTSYVTQSRRLDLASSNPDRFTITAFQIITSGATNLRHLNLRGSSLRWLRNEILQPVLFSNCNLTFIDLSFCSALTNGILFALATTECAKKLKVLKLESCGWADSEALITLFSATCSLVDVDLTGCWQSGDASVPIALSRNNPQLKQVTFANVYGLRDESVEFLARNLRSLEYLDLRECYRLTNASIFVLGEYGKSLQSLRVKGCRDVDEVSLDRIRWRGIALDVDAPQDPSRGGDRTGRSGNTRHINLQI